LRGLSCQRTSSRLTDSAFSWTSAKSPSSGAPYEGNLVAFGELGAADTIRPNFVRKVTFVHDLKPESLEQRGAVGQDKDLLDRQASSFLQQGFNELASYPPPLIGSPDGKGPNFCQVLPHDVKSPTPYDFFGLLIYSYEEISDLRVQFAYGTRQQVT
jgi:hypothetical protein